MNSPSSELLTASRTVLWLKQREQCERCSNCDDKRESGLGMRCTADAYSRYCIDVREQYDACGPDARLFVEK